MSSNICNIVNKFMNESGKEIFLIAAIAVVLYLILTYSSKPRVTANTMPNVTDSEIAEPFNEDDLFNTPANIPLAFDDAEPALITQPIYEEKVEAASGGDLVDFYNENLKGLDTDYVVNGTTDNLPESNYDNNYTLGVNVDDEEFVKLGGVPDTNKLISDDLLPKKSEDWFETPNVGTNVEDANLLADALFRGGINTVGTTNKNASYDLRGNIPNPKITVSPWNNSSYDPDNNIQGLCA